MNYNAKSINLEFLINFTKRDKEKIKRYIGMYLSSTPQAIEEMKKFLEENEFESVRLKAHSIKPQVQYMGIAELSAILLQIEKIVNEKQDTNQLTGLISSAETINMQATNELEKYLEEM